MGPEKEKLKSEVEGVPSEVLGVVMLSCPFCGKSEALRVCNSSENEEYPTNVDFYAVACDASKSNGIGPGGCGAAAGYAPTEARAIMKWNHRA